MKTPRQTRLAQTLPASVPFVGPETQERKRGKVFAARLGANESVFGPSPRAIAAMQKAAKDVWMYGDPESYDLTHALAKKHGVAPENILVGEGIDGILGYTVRLFMEPGETVVTSAGAYPTLNYHVAGFGGNIVTVPFTGDHEDPKALVAKAHEVGAKIVYLANPDNPMGTWHYGPMIDDMIAALPKGCLLILDEAYIEFAPQHTAPDLDVTNPQVLRMRTFSKAYGMAGARVGYAIGHAENIQAFNKIRNHFGMSRISQAGALEAFADTTYLAETLEKVAHAREHLYQIAQENGLTALPSATNFVTMDCGRDGAFAKRVLAELLARDIFVRMPFVAPQDRCIRVSAATETDLALFARALPEALQAASR
ncbi:pyridoxal phosphate-dependent aminotransferase [Falsihalocynthiibacter sp. BN13B15]|uniref:pyridoxal phosphate-dependent aminotransferase n=1 Tax=Falsihalocynthiibacter sp. BN13B15 TaxID=3240871 RepID=UPI00350F15FB